MRKGSVTGCAVALVLMAASAAPAQTGEPAFDRLRAAFQQEHLTLGALLQVVGDFRESRSVAGQNGFSVSNLRLRLEGRLDRGFEYFVQTSFLRSPALLDARIGYRLGGTTTLDAGAFKSPFSREFLTSAANIDFVNRSQVVSGLAPGRQVGAQVRGHGERFEWRAGAFNGNGLRAAGNDDGKLMYAARFGYWPYGRPGVAPADRRAEVAVSVATSRDAQGNVALLGAPFAGDRTLYGVDTRWQLDRLLLAGEAILSSLDPVGPGANLEPSGWHITAGWHVRPRSQLLLRWDAIRPDGIGQDRDLLILGWNLWPTQPTELQVNWIIDAGNASPRHHQLLVNLQVGF